MKKYTLDELLNTKKAQKIMDENLSSYNDENVVYAVLEINYGRYENGKTIYDFDDLENAINDIEKGRIQGKKLFEFLDCYTFVDSDEIYIAICDFIEKKEKRLYYSDCMIASELCNEYKEYLDNQN